MKSVTLYIVEDELLITLSLKNQLESFGYTIAGTATKCDACLNDLQDLKEQGKEPEIVLMDIHIRGETDGIETARRITERFDCGIIFITGQSSQEVYQRSFSIKPFGYLLKPIDLEQTVMTIEIAAYQRLLELQNKQYQKELVRMLDERTKETEEIKGMYLALLENSLMGLTIMREGRFIFANHQASRIFGYTQEEFLQFDMEQISLLIHPDDRERAIRLMRGDAEPEGETHSSRVRVYRKDGELIPLVTHVKRITFQSQPALHQSFLDLSILH
jgi:PAS domain S-box-containing protein